MRANGLAGRRWAGIGTLLLAVLALLAAGRSAAIMIYLGFAYADEVDPITAPLSYYVLHGDGEQLFASAAVALAISALAVLVGLAWAGVRVAGRPSVLFGVWALCLLAAAAFPVDSGPVITTFSGWVHQFAGAGILALLSWAGYAALPRLAEQPDWVGLVGVVRGLSAGAAVLAFAYLITRLPDVWPPFAVVFLGTNPGGLIQRLMLAFEMAVVCVLALQLARISWTATVRDRQVR